MNNKELKVEMVRHNDTGLSLSKSLGISNTSLSLKLNGKAEFTKSEMIAIKRKYQLSDERFMEIFFTNEVS